MRARNIKPGLCKNEDLGACSRDARLMFALLPMMADRAGRLEYRPARIRVELFPYDEDVTVAKIDSMFKELERFAGKFVIRYQANNETYVQIVNFVKHQNPHPREVMSVIPAPDGWDRDDCDTESRVKALPRQDLGVAQAMPSNGLATLIPDSPIPLTESPIPATAPGKGKKSAREAAIEAARERIAAV